MEIFKQYDSFKEKCADFPDKFEQKYFSGESKLICHPFVKGELISLCSDEEARSNALYICRMSDMLLMSDNGDDWSAFNLMEARSIAEQNGFIYISDLLAENAFLSEEWMINGKNDTIIVNEEYMREKGKKYAPVTPLTNTVLHFKKYNNGFFWKSSPIGEIISIDKKYIDDRFKEFFNECSTILPDLSSSRTINFKLFDGEVAVDAKTTRAIVIEAYFDEIDKMMETFKQNAELFEITGYNFSELDFILELTVAALKKNGVELSKDDFAQKYYSPIINSDDVHVRLSVLGKNCGSEDIDCIKLAFIDAVSAEYKEEESEEDVSYSAEDFSIYNTGIRKLEQGNYEGDEEKYLIGELVSHKPADYRIFYYAENNYPEEAENLKVIADFWQLSPISEEDMENIILNDYILDESFDEQGRFCAGYEQSCILKEQLEKVNAKYGLSTREYIIELEEHIEIMDKERRTFNGTLFDTPEEMQLAVKNEVYVRDLCRNLSALNESELRFLIENIENTTLDEDTKAKYLVKVNLAMNVVQTSALEQCCLSLPVMTLGEIAALRNEISEYDYPEAVVKPFISRIKQASDAAQKTELEGMLENPDKLSDAQIESILEKLNSGRYDDSIANYYRIKTLEIKDNNIRTEIEILIEGMEDLGREQLEELIKTLSGDTYPKHLTYGPLKKLTDTLNNYDANEAAKVFAGVEFATAEQLEAMKQTIEYGRFSDDIIEPYLAKVEQREQDLLNEELDEMCNGIDSMSQEELDKLKDDIQNADKDFDKQLVEKYLDQIAQRVIELKNSELAELCKYIFSMEQPELDELKVKLAGENYDKEFTAVYYKKIEEREHELLIIEVDELCGDLTQKEIPQLEELKETIRGNEKYAQVCEKYIASIDSRIEAIKIADYKKIIAGTVDMTPEQIAEFRRNAEEKRGEIGEELYRRSIEAADQREDAIETEKIERIAGNIEEYDFEKAEAVKAELTSGKYSEEKTTGYITRIDERLYELNKAELDSYIADIEGMDKEQLIQAQIRIQEYSRECPSELKQEYVSKVEKALAEIADKEIREICGNIESLTAKKSSEIIRKLNTMPLDENAKNRYIDALDAHIAALKEQESKDFIMHLSIKMDDFGLTAVHLCVPGLSNLFFSKYDAVCKSYISPGRYELPILLHEANNNDSFTLTTEYLYTFSKGVVHRIKIEDVASFQAKKSLMSSSLTAVEKNGNSQDMPHAFNKNIVENVAKVLTSLVSFIHDKRSAEHMKEMLETAAQEKAIQASAPASKPAPEAVPEEKAQEPAAEQKAAEKPVEENKKPEAEENKKPEPTEDKKPEAEESKKSETEEDKKPEAAEDKKPEAEEDKKPEAEEEKKPEAEEDKKPEAEEDKNPEAEEDKKPETAEDKKPEAEEDKKPEHAEDRNDDEAKISKPAHAAPEHMAENPEEPKVRFCDQCGAKIPSPKAKFCMECGNKLV